MKTVFKTLLVNFLLFASSGQAQENKSFQSQVKAMILENNPANNVATMQRIIRELKLDTIHNSEEIDVLKGIIALTYLKIDSLKQFEDYVNTIKNLFNQTSYLNMGANQLFQQQKKMTAAEQIAKKTIDLYLSYKDNSNAKPTSISNEDWNRFMGMAAYPYYTTYAQILHANKDDAKALKYLKILFADEQFEMADPSILALYITILIKNGKDDKAYQILLQTAQAGKTDDKMNQQLKALYEKRTGSKEKAKVFIDSITSHRTAFYQKDLGKKMILNTQAPGFSLLDIKGNSVSLSDYKGTVVVLDFWATWCAPCLAAMPAMEAVSKGHPKVVFLFIATQETGNNHSQKVATFLKKRSFPSNSLIDVVNSSNPKLFKTALAYQLKGIPSKIVIDKNGMLRFLSTGFTTTADLINELTAMIALANQQN